MAVAAGNRHTVAVGEDGAAFAFGDNGVGQLGMGDFPERLTPTRVAGLPAPVRQVAAGTDHTGIVTDAGDLLMCGCGRGGRLGLGDEDTRETPTRVARDVFDDEAVLMVACGDQHTVVATEGGSVYTFGSGWYGRLGHGDHEGQLAPRRVPAAGFRPNGSAEGPGERVVMVAAGARHTVALSEAGHVFTWGQGWRGKLGHNDDEDQLAPRQVEAWLFGGEKVVFVAAGTDQTVAVTAGGRLYTWGHNHFGQLGHGNTEITLVPTLVGAEAFGGSAVVMAACGGDHTLVVTQDGALWACGHGYNGRLGLNNDEDSHVFARVPAVVFDGARVVAAAAGFRHSAAVTDDGALWTWGRGGGGHLGHGDNFGRMAPVRVAPASFVDEEDNLILDTRISRCLSLPAANALAFVMGTHHRLGLASQVTALAGESGLPAQIAEAARSCIGGAAGRTDSLIRLIGGGLGHRHA